MPRIFQRWLPLDSIDTGCRSLGVQPLDTDDNLILQAVKSQ